MKTTAFHYQKATIKARLKKAEIIFESRIITCRTEEEMDVLVEQYRILVQEIKNPF